GFGGGRKGHHQAVPGALHLGTAVRRDGFAQDAVVGTTQFVGALVAESLPNLRRGHEIREQDSGGARSGGAGLAHRDQSYVEKRTAPWRSAALRLSVAHVGRGRAN